MQVTYKLSNYSLMHYRIIHFHRRFSLPYLCVCGEGVYGVCMCSGVCVWGEGV